VLPPPFGTTAPGGNQPPFQHVPPPSETNGSGVAHVLLTTGAVGARVGTGAGLGAAFPPGGTIPGGSQPPFQHTPPPIVANGSGVAQVPPLDGGAGTGVGVGVGGGVGAGAGADAGPLPGVLLLPVERMKSPDVLSVPRQFTECTRK